MKLANDTVTLINHKYDSTLDRDVLHATVIRGVHWYATDVSGITANGLKASDTYVLRVPTSADFSNTRYIDPKTYDSAGSVQGLFTFKQGDLIVRGTLRSMEGVTDQSLQATYETMKLLTITDNTKAPNAPHWRLTGA